MVVEGINDVCGTPTITFDGSGLPSGVYIYQLTAGKCVASGKMVLLE